MKKTNLIIIFISIFFLAKVCFAITLLLEDEALQRLFPGTGEITKETITAGEEQISGIKKALGGSLVYKTRGKESLAIESKRDFVFYYAKKENKLEGVALILDEPGKWGPIKFIIRLSPAGEIEGVLVMKYTETRGRPVASRSFLKQFFGKGINDPLQLNNDIQGVSGATVSSHAACFTMKKAMILYKALVLKEKL